MRLGPGGPARPARARASPCRSRSSGARIPGLRPAADRDRPGGAGRCCGCCSRRTRWGALVRAATQDREMVGALGVDQAGSSPRCSSLGAVLAGPRRRAADPARARQPRTWICGHRRRLRRHGGRRPGQPRPARSWPRMLIGVAKAFWHRLLGSSLQAHPGRRVPGHGAWCWCCGPTACSAAAGAGRAPRRCAAAAAAAAPLGRPSRVAGSCCSLLVPLVGRPLRHRAADRHRLLRAVRRQPALHHGPGRHGVVRPRRLLRPRRLCRRARCSSRPACRWKPALVAGAARRRRCRRGLSAGSACACRASISPC